MTGWRYRGLAGRNQGYTYRSNLVRITAAISNGKALKAHLRGQLGLDLQVDPAPLDATLTLGGHSYCLRFAAGTAFTAGKRFTAKAAPAPAACLP